MQGSIQPAGGRVVRCGGKEGRATTEAFVLVTQSRRGPTTAELQCSVGTKKETE